MPFPVSHPLRAALAVLLLAAALTGLPAVAPAGAMPIEGYPTYQPQSRCSPTAKPGTVMLAEYLVRRYPGSGSSGIARSCTASGISEHKEGRAFDWRLDARSARDRDYAQDFLTRLFAADRRGNANALARRMGVMYVIWNDRIWSASSGYRPRAYLHGACSAVSSCGVTLRHRDHMHLSLTRAAGRGETSWYVRRGAPRPAVTPAPAPAPKPTAAPTQTPRRLPALPDGIVDLRREPFKKLFVRATGDVLVTRWKLQAGTTYSLTAAGLYSYGSPSRVADAVCTWSARSNAWAPKPDPAVRQRFGALTMVVNGERVFGDTCRGSHIYRTTITPSHDRVLRVKLLGDHRRSQGGITLVVGRARAKVRAALPTYPALAPAPAAGTGPEGYGLISETVVVPGGAGAVYTRSALSPRATYRVTVRGQVRLAGGVRSNGQCVSLQGKWYRSASIDRRVPAQDHGDLYLNGAPFSGRSADGCAGKERTVELSPDAPGRLRLDLWDPHSRADNTGRLTVSVQRLTAIPTPRPADRAAYRGRQPEWHQSRDWFTIDPARRRGRLSTMLLRRGERVQVFVKGRYKSHGYDADASCVQNSAGRRTARLPGAVDSDPLNLWVDGQAVQWRALGQTPECSAEYRYTTEFVATKYGPLRIGVFDLDHRDNEGQLEVTLLREKR